MCNLANGNWCNYWLSSAIKTVVKKLLRCLVLVRSTISDNQHYKDFVVFRKYITNSTCILILYTLFRMFIINSLINISTDLHLKLYTCVKCNLL